MDKREAGGGWEIWMIILLPQSENDVDCSNNQTPKQIMTYFDFLIFNLTSYLKFKIF